MCLQFSFFWSCGERAGRWKEWKMRERAAFVITWYQSGKWGVIKGWQQEPNSACEEDRGKENRNVYFNHQPLHWSFTYENVKKHILSCLFPTFIMNFKKIWCIEDCSPGGHICIGKNAEREMMFQVWLFAFNELTSFKLFIKFMDLLYWGLNNQNCQSHHLKWIQLIHKFSKGILQNK